MEKIALVLIMLVVIAFVCSMLAYWRIRRYGIASAVAIFSSVILYDLFLLSGNAPYEVLMVGAGMSLVASALIAGIVGGGFWLVRKGRWLAGKRDVMNQSPRR